MIRVICFGLVLLGSLWPISFHAQQYDGMWKEVEMLQKKDLPQSVMEAVSRIYQKASEERNVPQMMKAYLMRSSYQVMLTPDSLYSERRALEQWASEEPDRVGRAVLNSILGSLALEASPSEWQQALTYFRRSLNPADVLGKTSAKSYRPMTVSESFSERFFGDNLFDLLTRRAIQALQSDRNLRRNVEVQGEVMSMYDRLIAFYGEQNRNAALLTKEAKLLYQLEQVQVAAYRLDRNEGKKALEQLKAEYDGEEACADVYVKLGRFYDRPMQRLQLAREGLAKYPKSDLKKTLQQQVDEILLPALDLHFSSVYPKQEVEMQVRYKNLERFAVECYRLNVRPSQTVADGEEGEQTIRRYGKKVGTQRYTLMPTPDFEQKDTLLAYRMPQAGIYMLKMIPESGKEGVSYSLIYVSPYQAMMLPASNEQLEVIAIDRNSGHPVPQAEIAIYERKDSRYTLKKAYTTDSQGSVLIPFEKNRYNTYQNLYLNVRTPGNDFMAIEHYYPRGLGSFDEKGSIKQKATLFSDRSLYRPGQTVHVSGVVYQQVGDSVTVVPSVSGELKCSGNGQEIAKLSVTTDEFGVFSGDIVLPNSMLAGYYYFSAFGCVLSLRVEEYKRPTFEVVMDSYEQAYQLGDSIEVTGRAMYFSGVPVRSSQLTYTVSRSLRGWWRASGGEEEIAQGKLETDAEGRFRIPVLLTPPSDADGQGKTIYHYNYQVNVQVTGEAGESQEGSLDLPIAVPSIGLTIRGLEQIVVREKQEKVQFLALNLTRQPVKVNVKYQVYELDKQNRIGALKLEGEQESSQSFMPADLLSLPSGRYRMVATACDEKGRPCEAQHDFILWSMTETAMPASVGDWFYCDSRTFRSGQPVSVFVGTSEEDVYLFMDVYQKDKRIASERLTLSREIRRFDFPYRPEYGDAVTVHFVYVRNHQAHTNTVKLERPQPEKQLQLKWETFRDKLRPGTAETWTVQVTDLAGRPVRANLLASMYDASLDRLYPHRLAFQLHFNRIAPYVWAHLTYSCLETDLQAQYKQVYPGDGYALLSFSTFSRLTDFAYYRNRIQRRVTNLSARMYATDELAVSVSDAAGVELKEESLVSVEQLSAKANAMPLAVAGEDTAESAADEYGDVEALPEVSGQVNLRENFQETAFYYPNLRTDSLGRVSVSFTVPEALTEWRFLGLAHTEAVDYALLDARTRTFKDFMIQPNLPRFVRLGDEAVMSASIMNLSMDAVKGKAWMELSDPLTGRVIYRKSQNFSVDEGMNDVVRFAYTVSDEYDVLVCKVWAEAGDMSDGEQHYLPVLSNREWITETIPVQLDGETEQQVDLTPLFNHRSKTATHQKLTVELTANPVWYAVQALPVVGNPEADDAFSWMVAYYANAVSKQLISTQPKLAQVIRAWKEQGSDAETWLSQLQRNADLKNLLLNETPWLMDAQDETARKRNLAFLLDENAMNQRLRTAVGKLQSLQADDGGWGWYPGMNSSRYTTTEIVLQLARLQAMGVVLASDVKQLYSRALTYLMAKLNEEYTWLRKVEKQKEAKPVPSESAIDYLYVCALDPSVKSRSDAAMLNGLLDRLMKRTDAADYTIRSKARIALILDAFGQKQKAQEWLKSIEEYAVYTPEMGRYYDTPKAAYAWRSYRVPTQVAAMEAMRTLGTDEKTLGEMQQWLLKQKQVQAWETPLATADALYALLSANRSLQEPGRMEAKAGAFSMSTGTDAVGYVRETLPEETLNCPSLVVSKTGTGIGWGAVYAQYAEKMNALNQPQAMGQSAGLTIVRQLLKAGQPVTDDTPVTVGDRLTVRLTVSADRDMDFIQIADSRAACLEPVEQLSGYQWQGTLGLYRVSRDASTCFFLDQLRKGSYVIEYDVYADRIGTYQAGTATVQSVYAPEFSARTGGMTITVK